MGKLLVVVDMQNDFIDGSLGTNQAKEIVPGVAMLIRNFDGSIVMTRDTHSKGYLRTQEGKKLPVEHCILGTHGWEYHPMVTVAFDVFKNKIKGEFLKNTFGSSDFCSWLMEEDTERFDEIHFVGLCTGICVISNAVLAKAAQPEAKIIIHKDLCACVTKESHETALETMKLLQMEVI